METKRKLLAISHQHIFFNYSSVLSALLGHVFSSCCCPHLPPSASPPPLALNSCCCCCCSFVFICTGSESLCMAAFCEKKEKKKESREMTEADGRAAAYPGEAEYPCHRAYIWLCYYLTCTNRSDLWPLDSTRLDFCPAPCANVGAIYFSLALFMALALARFSCLCFNVLLLNVCRGVRLCVCVCALFGYKQPKLKYIKCG